MPLTLDEIMEVVERAAPVNKVAVAERLLADYDGDDKELGEPDIMSIACLGSQEFETT